MILFRNVTLFVGSFPQMLFTEKNSDIRVGDGCSSVSMPIATIGAFWKYPQVSFSSTIPTLSDKENYLFFARVVSPDTKQILAWIGIAQAFNWTRIGLIATSEDVNTLMATNFNLEAQKAGITVELYSSYAPGPGSNVAKILGQFYEN
jgi:hypothetical protein